MSEVSIREQIKKLVALQAIDKEIYRFEKEKNDQPQIVAQLQKIFEDKKVNLKALEDNLKALLVKRKDRELSLAIKEGDTKKSQTQMYALKTNKEYQAKLKEIEGINADKSVLEEEILKILVELDVLKAQTDQENELLKKEEVVFLSEKKKIEDRLQEVEAQLTDAQAKRKQVIPEIDKKILASYERILRGREGMALAAVKDAVKDYSCQGCFINVTAQVVNEIKKHDRLVICESCARILYLEDEL
ncbi:MAG: C4-type zinc ribbon domain-containing protein [Candidatus Omnitrophota bacterium]|nr:C4-type zinc ribbon domain-containing protein [Candidatus Omnitrophota bacterium]